MRKKLKLLSLCLIFPFVFGSVSCQKDKGNGNDGDTDTSDKGLYYSRSFTEEEYSNPANKYKPMPIVNNAGGEYIVELARDYGYGGIVTNIMFSDRNYLHNEEAVELFHETIDSAVENGLRIWLYDENGYPSGTAGGKVTEENPLFEAQGIVANKYEVSRGQTVNIEVPYKHTLLSSTFYSGNSVNSLYTSGKDIKSSLSNGKITYTADADGVIVCRYQKNYFEGTHATANWYAVRKQLDMLNADATDAFIESTYERYYSLVGEHFGKEIEAFFTDEPAMAGLYLDPPQFKVNVEDTPDENIPLLPTANYTWDFENYFAQKRGYSLGDNAIYLFEGDSDTAKRVRWDFYKTITELKSNNYEGNIAQWCEEHNVAFSGHFFDEENVYDHPYYSGNLMRSLSKQQIPGIDFLSNNMSVAVGWAAVTPKMASSAAHFNGGNKVFCEISNDYDGTKADVYGKINTAALLYACGVNEFGSYFRIIGSSNMGEENHKMFSSSLGRMGYLLKGGVQTSSTALYYPAESLYVNAIVPEDGRRDSINSTMHSISTNFTQIAKNMLVNQIGYEIFDAENIIKSSVNNGYLVTPSGMKFKNIIIPTAYALEEGVAEKLVEAVDGGVNVILQNVDNVLAQKTSYQSTLNSLLSKIKGKASVCATVDAITNKVKGFNTEGVKFIGANNGVIASEFMYKDGNKSYIFVNTTGATQTVNANINSVGTKYKMWYVAEEKVKAISASTSGNYSRIGVTIPANQSVIVTVE